MAVIAGASLGDVYSRLHDVDGYNPMDAETFADWSTEAGDIVTIVRGNDEYEVPVHSARMVWKGAPQTTLSAGGNRKRESLAKVSKDKFNRNRGSMNNERENNKKTGIRTYTGLTAPENPKEGDLWLESTGIRTWDDADLSWTGSDYDWSQLRGTKVKVYKNGVWQLSVDETVLAETADFYKTDTQVGLFANRLSVVEGQLKYETSRLDVRADHITSTVREEVEGLGSEIRQTATQIRSEVHAANSTLYSYINQTATHIESVVANTASGLGSAILQTACQIRSEVHAGESTIYSYVNQTATHIESVVASTASSLGSSILQTACQIRSEVHAGESTIYSYVNQTATHIEQVVASTASSLGSSILQTASSIRSEVHASESTIYSYVEQTATSIRSEVASSVSGLQSSITQNANRIALVVDGNGIKPASIVAAINDGESSIIISANHINLDGYVKATDITTTLVATKLAAADNVNAKKLTLTNNGYIVLPTGDGTMNLTGATAVDIIRGLKVVQSGNGYKLQAITYGDASWHDLPNSTFSRAVGSWSVGGGSGNVNVTANPQSQTKSVPVSIGGSNSITSNGTYIYKVYYEDASGDDQETGSSMNVTVNVPAGDYNTGYNAGGQTAYVYPTVYTENKSGYTVDSEITIPAGQTRYIVAVYTNLGGNAQWGAAKSMKVTAGNRTSCGSGWACTYESIPTGSTYVVLKKLYGPSESKPFNSGSNYTIYK